MRRSPTMSAVCLALACAVTWAPARPASACASCGCGDDTLTATGVERPYVNRIRVLAEERYGSLTLGQEHTDFLRTSLAASWSPLRRLTIGLILPWMTSFIHETPLPRSTVTGLGDLELALRGVVYQERSFAPHHVLWVGGGLKMPTGRASRDQSGLPVSDDDRPGSGSWDPFASVTYAWFSGSLLSAYASTTGRWTTAGWHGYVRGATVGGSALLQIQPFGWGAVQLGADLLWQRPDTLGNGNFVPNTGGTTVYLAGGLLGNPWRDLLLRLVVDAPVVQALRGTQSVGPQVTLQVAYDFN